MIPQTLKSQFEKYDQTLKLECDGFTRVLDYLLEKNNIQHETYIGHVKWNNKQFEPHLWIFCNNIILDYRLQLWFGKFAPHGIFQIKKDNNIFTNEKINIVYTGEPISLKTSDIVFNILTEGL